MKIMGNSRCGCPVPSMGMTDHSQRQGMTSGPKGTSNSLRAGWYFSPYKGNPLFPARSEQTGTLCKERLARGQLQEPVAEAWATAEVPRVRT